MTEKTDAIAALESARKEMVKAIEGIPDDKMTTPAFGTWSVKDVICHLTSWEQYAAPDLQRVARGHVPQLATFRMEEIDDWNAWLMRSRNLFSLSQARLELDEAQQEATKALDVLPDALFGAGQPARLLTDALITGHTGHAADIRAWRQKEGV